MRRLGCDSLLTRISTRRRVTELKAGQAAYLHPAQLSWPAPVEQAAAADTQREVRAAAESRRRAVGCEELRPKAAKPLRREATPSRSPN